MDFPPHGFGIFGEAAGAADKNQDWTPRPNLPAAWRLYRGSLGRKTEKLDFRQKWSESGPYGDSGGFDVTGWSGIILRIDLDPGSPIFCLTE